MEPKQPEQVEFELKLDITAREFLSAMVAVSRLHGKPNIAIQFENVILKVEIKDKAQ